VQAFDDDDTVVAIGATDCRFEYFCHPAGGYTFHKAVLAKGLAHFYHDFRSFSLVLMPPSLFG